MLIFSSSLEAYLSEYYFDIFLSNLVTVILLVCFYRRQADSKWADF